MERKNQLKICLTSPLAGGACRTGKSERCKKGNNFMVSPSSVCSDFVRQTTSPAREEVKQLGFTLIELLVVVLIIGILAAVALPQYTLAVNKTRFANLRSTANAFIKASEAYYLANNEWPSNFDELALDLPGGFVQNTVGTHTCGKNVDMYCCMIKGVSFAPAINCGNNEYTFSFYSIYANYTGTGQRENYCVAKENDTKAKQLCKAVTGKNGTIMGWALLTPDNTQGGTSGYRWYLF